MRLHPFLPTCLPLLAALLPPAPAQAAAPAWPGERAVEAPFCASPAAPAPAEGGCLTADGRLARFWWGHLQGRDLYLGFATLRPGRAAARDTAQTIPLVAVTFRREGGQWREVGHSAPFGGLRNLGAGQPVEGDDLLPPAQAALPDGGLVLAIPTIISDAGTATHGYEILRREGATGAWRSAGAIPGAVDDSRACRDEAKVEGTDPRACDVTQGSLFFGQPGPEGWPDATVSLDLVSRRNGQPFTTTGWEVHIYHYDPAAGRYAESQ